MSPRSVPFRDRLVAAAFEQRCNGCSPAKFVHHGLLVCQNSASQPRHDFSWIGRRIFQLHIRFSSNIPGMTRKRREHEFERIVENEKSYKKVLALKEILLKEPEQVISLGELGMLRRPLGMKGNRRFVTLIRKYPAIFEVYEDEDKVMWCGFATQAEKLVEEELEMRRAYETVAVEKLRKLLMMSVDKRLHVAKIAHLRRDLGFPDDFQKRMVHGYPEYFRVVEQKDGPVLELTAWDSSLAVTALEKRAKETGSVNSEGEPLFKVCVSKRFTLTMKQKAALQKFQERSFISPYTDAKDYKTSTAEFEKRNVALLHEILSMTLEKKTIIDYLTHFRKEYRLPQSVLSLVLRHHAIFYLSRKGGRFRVFLKEGYEGENLTEKNEWVVHKERYIELMALGKKLKKLDEDEEAKNEADGQRENPMDDDDEDTEEGRLSGCGKVPIKDMICRDVDSFGVARTQGKVAA